MNAPDETPDNHQPGNSPTMSGSAQWLPTRPEIRAAAFVAVGLTLFGILLAVPWWLIASHADARQIVLPNGIVWNPDDSEQFFTGDGWFIVLTAIVGLLAGIGAVLWRSTRGPWMFVALAVGGLLGALLTSWLGSIFDGPAQAVTIPEIGPARRLPIQLNSSAALVVEPFCAVAFYLIAAIVNRTFTDQPPGQTIPTDGNDNSPV